MCAVSCLIGGSILDALTDELRALRFAARQSKAVVDNAFRALNRFENYCRLASKDLGEITVAELAAFVRGDVETCGGASRSVFGPSTTT